MGDRVVLALTSITRAGQATWGPVRGVRPRIPGLTVAAPPPPGLGSADWLIRIAEEAEGATRAPSSSPRGRARGTRLGRAEGE